MCSGLWNFTRLYTVTWTRRQWLIIMNLFFKGIVQHFRRCTYLLYFQEFDEVINPRSTSTYANKVEWKITSWTVGFLLQKISHFDLAVVVWIQFYFPRTRLSPVWWSDCSFSCPVGLWCSSVAVLTVLSNHSDEYNAVITDVKLGNATTIRFAQVFMCVCWHQIISMFNVSVLKEWKQIACCKSV